LVEGNAGRLLPGMRVTGWLRWPGQALSGVYLPASTIVRMQGRPWVYLQKDETTFAREEVLLEHAADRGWVVERGLETGDRVVVTGAQLLLSEELKSQIQMAD